MENSILITGGCGFIGTNFILKHAKEYTTEKIINLDCLTYAGRRENLISLENTPQYKFIQGNICDKILVDKLLAENSPRAIVHFAAESHVDNSISGPSVFIETNINGTFQMLESARKYFNKLSEEDKKQFIFVHVSTDEVYGSLRFEDEPFTEETTYKPNSPYSASKASADHLVRAYFHTYGLPTIITNCSNNYGPFQFPEKLIPRIISCALAGKELPVYGNGLNIRDWIYVEDHCSAINRVLYYGIIGEKYNIGGNQELSNISLVENICDILQKLTNSHIDYKSQIKFVKDRAGHDLRYAINSYKIHKDIGWKPTQTFQQGLEKTISWYLNNKQYLSK